MLEATYKAPRASDSVPGSSWRLLPRASPNGGIVAPPLAIGHRRGVASSVREFPDPELLRSGAPAAVARGRGEQSCGRCGGPSGGQAPRRSARRAAIIEHVRGARDLDAVRAALLTTFDGFPLQGDTLQPRPRREALLGLVSSIDSDFTRGMRHSGNRSSSESQCPCQTQLSPTLRRPSSRAARSARPRPLPSNRSSASAGTSRCRSARACPTR